MPYKSIAVSEVEGKGRGIVAAKSLRKGEIILRFGGRLFSRWQVKNPNAALQLDEDLFMESDGAIDECLNHSCSPNCFIDFDQLTLVAWRDINLGEELTFDYHTSEYDLVDQECSFTCLCGSENCIHEVKGFRYLPASHRKDIVPFLSPFLKRKWMEENGLPGPGRENPVDF